MAAQPNFRRLPPISAPPQICLTSPLIGFELLRRGRAMRTPYDIDLDKNAANFQPLTPLTFLERAASVFPGRPAVIHGQRRSTYAEFYARARRLASALAQRGIKRGDTVSVMLANTPAMLEAHYGVPMTGAVLNSINTRLAASAIAFMLDHPAAKVLTA